MGESAKPQPTLELVAARAGVSRATVSRVVNGSTKVSAEVNEQVNKAIAELKYVPNRAARSLANGRTNSIALVIPENAAKFFSDPYFATVIQGAAMYLADTEFTLTLLIATEADPAKTGRYLRGGNVDGALILSHHSDDRSYVELAGSLPMVFGGRPMSDESGELHVVDVDNVAAAITATRTILESGRRRIATIAGPQNMGAGQDRLQGWHDALEAVGLATDLIEFGDFTPPGGEAAMISLLDRGVDIDGIFIASAQMAFGALKILHERGIRVPEDISITTVDNDSYAQSASPPLTTIEQPAERQGAMMAQLLVKLIAGGEVPERTIINTELIKRGSH
ncbi:LacI family DNA-binding transcriptional regulator [Paeniglutamicibacter sp. Y32M11]|uniref:LacI family DNA-binding transcriptional regulator n=1 Tax=Paeniglutamicibacter sp. Y32M11 TaxID=2853258 RepID=UPI001C52DC1B|nr:LacI family DNA-binding transcriptional regulator [Paeniglutamicibacter sp. Y32M11]QXQ10737.1 LacI family transcriptional regulator [Paeniglutamicibacter sp. Y32M11]